jgi:hypothetical protein
LNRSEKPVTKPHPRREVPAVSKTHQPRREFQP